MSIVGILKAAIGFGLLIFVHELGHFLAARWMGVRVEVFSLGFGKALFKKKRGDTVYQLSAIPFGGYVKMAGEEEDPSKPAPADNFNAKSVGRRSVIFAAGVVMNIIFGFLVFVLAYRVGVPTVPAVAGEIEPGSPAWMSGIERGDEIVGINRIGPPVDFEDLRVTVTITGRGEALHLRIKRDGQELQKDVVPEYQEELGLKSAGIGIPFSMALADPKALPGPKDGLDYSVLYANGAQAGDVIVAAGVDGGPAVPVQTPTDLDAVVDMAGGKPVDLVLRRPGEPETEPRVVKVGLVPVGAPTWLGIHFGSNRVSAVRPGSWADAAGVKKEDRITAINGRRARSPSEIEEALKGEKPQSGATAEMMVMQGSYDTAQSLIVLRDGQSVPLNLPRNRPGRLSDALAFYPDLTVDEAWLSYPARNAGMEPGDVIVALNGVLVQDHAEFSNNLAKGEGKPQLVTWKRDGKEMSASMLQQKRWILPVPRSPEQQTMRAGFFGSIKLGGRKAFQWIVRIYGTLKGLLGGQISIGNLNGPLAIGYVTYEATKEGMGKLLYLLGVLSVNLGVFNLLPIPVLDGGHLFFALIEKLRGKPVSERIRAGATYAGLVLILCIAAVAMWNDLMLFFTRL